VRSVNRAGIKEIDLSFAAEWFRVRWVEEKEADERSCQSNNTPAMGTRKAMETIASGSAVRNPRLSRKGGGS